MPNTKLLLVFHADKALELIDRLVDLGYGVLPGVKSNEQALQSISMYEPDLLIVGIREEQGLAGIEFGQQVYTRYDIPVIYISDRSGQTTIQRSRGTAPFGYLFDPTNEKEIIATIEVALNRHKMEKRLRASKQWLNAIVNSISDGLIVTDMNEIVRFANPIMEELTGKAGIDTVGKPVNEVLKLFYANSDEPITFSHVLSFFQNQNFRTKIDAKLLRPDGAKTSVEVSISPISSVAVPSGVVLTVRDISDRKRALEDMHRHARWSDAMRKATKHLSSSLDAKVVLNQVCEVSNQTSRRMQVWRSSLIRIRKC